MASTIKLPDSPETLMKFLDVMNTPEDVFGVRPIKADDPAWLSRTTKYMAIKRMLTEVDPDLREIADEYIEQLETLWKLYKTPKITTHQVTDQTLKVNGLFRQGNLTNLYLAEMAVDGSPTDVVVKIASNPDYNSYLLQERLALIRLRDNGIPAYSAFVPDYISSFKHHDPVSGAEREVNVLRYLSGFVSLAELKPKFPNGIDPKDLAWMWRRLLIAIGNAANVKLIHGSVIPSNILIHPAKHGLVLTDWCMSVIEDSGAVRGWFLSDEKYYAPEIRERKEPDFSTDIYMSAKVMQSLASDLPLELEAFVDYCTQPDMASRPHSAFKLKEQFDQIIVDLWGPRTFREFIIPS